MVKNEQYSFENITIDENFEPHIETVQKYVSGINEVINIKGLIQFQIEEYYTMFDFGNTVFVVSDTDINRYKQKIDEITKLISDNSISYQEITSRRR